LDVWLNNIKAILEIKIDAGCKWEEELQHKAYPPDAVEFIVHTRSFYLSFCTPSDPNDEFLMTENSYGIHEGPKSTIADPYSGKILTTFHTEYHTFAHIAPNLTMILRSFLLPSPTEDLSENIEKREKCYKSSICRYTISLKEPRHFWRIFLSLRPETHIRR
jgi:hypothetical protein